MNKICILTSVHPVFDTRIFHKEAKSLAKSRYDVLLIAQHDKEEIAEGAKCGIYVDPLNPEEIAGTIRWIIEIPIEAQEMVEKGQHSVVDKYNWEQESQKLLMLYEELFKQ